MNSPCQRNRQSVLEGALELLDSPLLTKAIMRKLDEQGDRDGSVRRDEGLPRTRFHLFYAYSSQHEVSQICFMARHRLPSVSGINRVLATLLMKLASPSQRGTTWK